MEKFLAEQKLLLFWGSLLVAVGGWGATAGSWADLCTPAAIFGLIGIVGGVFLANVTSNVFKTKPPEVKP